MAEEKGPAEKKRQKISKAQQLTMLEVLGASLVLGTCAVISIFLIKYIGFNTKVISEKGLAISDYDETLRNVGVCQDEDNNGRLSDKELEKCKPNELSLSQVPDSLRFNAMEVMSENADLESVARHRSANCFDSSGNKIDFNQLYEDASDLKEREQYLQSGKICSALRVVPDALPSVRNNEAILASINQMFVLAGTEMDSLAPVDDATDSLIEGLATIPVNIRMEGTDGEVMSVLDVLERSIREVDITTATIEWTSIGLNLNAAANAYYLETPGAVEVETTVYAGDRKTTKSSAKPVVEE